MAVTGQISVARVGRSVQIFERTSDIIDVFDPNATPDLQEGDHVTLYPGDYRNDLQGNPITIPTGVFVTILPGAIVGVESITAPIQQRYRNIEGAVANIADLNIADQYTTQIERQSSRVRVYSENTQNSGVDVPFRGFGTLEDAARDADPGDKIVVFPGLYEPTANLFVGGVDWQFLEGAIVDYKKENFGGLYPHALFDDKRDIDGQPDISGGSECNVYGSGEFRIGTENPVGTVADTSGQFWDDWNLYGILALNADSFMDFNAKKVLMKKNADAAFKVSSGQRIDINIGEVEIENTLPEQFNIPKTDSVPAVCVINGTEKVFSFDGDFSIDVGKYTVRERAGQSLDEINAYFISTLRQNDYDGSRRAQFQTDLTVSIGETNVETAQNDSRTFLFSNGFSPDTVIIEGSGIGENNGGINLVGSAGNQTKFVIKESVVSTSGILNTAPLRLAGDPAGLNVNITESFLITGENVDFNNLSQSSGKFSIINSTGQTDFDIKFYGACFADTPIQNFQQILHPELNDVQWSQDVELLL